MGKKRRKKLSDQLRDAIDECGVTRYRIAKETGIDQATLCRFASGERGISWSAADRLGEYLGLRIVRDKPKPKAESGKQKGG